LPNRIHEKTYKNDGTLYRIDVGNQPDGVDAVLLAMDEQGRPHVEADSFLPFPSSIRQQVLALQTVDNNELDRAAQLGNALARRYAEVVAQLLARSALPTSAIKAIGCHGQTIRHAPHAGYTLQIGNHALLAELCGIDVVADFRSRDVAAGGHGAPLVPAFHQDIFASDGENRVILNIGGISNLTRLAKDLPVSGFDCGPGNMLLDAWCQHHTGLPMMPMVTGQRVASCIQHYCSRCWRMITSSSPPKARA
jgi:anhydro-N-acetylmuramic acid kinase